jgi:hypothetical protein
MFCAAAITSNATSLQTSAYPSVNQSALHRAMRILFPILLALLSACSPSGGAVDAPETNISGHFTQQIVISDHPHHRLMGHLISAMRDGVQMQALVIGQRRDGVHRLRIYEAWSGGTQLPFASTTQQLDGCTHGHCRDNAVGIVFLPDALFDHARAHGFTARLLGRSGAINIRVPPDLFLALPI